MECSCCINELSFEEYISLLNNQDIHIPSTFSPHAVWRNHQIFHNEILSLTKTKKEINFFDKDHIEKVSITRPVLLHVFHHFNVNEDGDCENCHRKGIDLIQMKINHIHKDHQITLWIVTQAEPTNLMDGTIYLIVRDQYDFHIRLIIRNWSYMLPTNEIKSKEELSKIINELLPIDSMIKLNDPLLTKCFVDNQLTLCCDSPNLQLILAERIKKCFVFDKLDDLRERGNQSYIHGNIQLAIDYYTFAINRITNMAQMTISNDNECEMDLFRNAFQFDLCRLHSNRSACYLREDLYSGANLDSLVVVTGRFFNETYDEFYLKCLHRLICANIGLQEYTFIVESFCKLIENPSINFTLRLKFLPDFNEIQSSLPRLKDEHKHGNYDLKIMFKNQLLDQKTFFDVHDFHSNYKNNSCIKKRNNSFYAKCDILPGTLLIVQRAFAYVQTTGDDKNDQRRLLNTIEKRFIMAPTVWEFESIRHMPTIDQWFKNETDAEENDFNSYPKSIPWNLLVKTQQENPFRSKSIIGWWPDLSVFKQANDSKQKSNCLWFICGKTIFLFNFIAIKKNEEFLIGTDQQISLFVKENRKNFTLNLGHDHKIRLNEIFDQLEKTQIYLST